MWADPIDNALAELQGLVEQMQKGPQPSADHVVRAGRAAQQARDARAFEQREGRLVTPEDRW